jgi:predicted NBD/HSP70 family sugar kinase
VSLPHRSAPARQPSLREHNLALVLGEIAASGPASRARVASATGLTKATVSSLVDTLVAAGLLRESGPHPAGGVGRPATDLALDPGPVGIGLEINVDYLATCTVDLTGTVRRHDLLSEDFRVLGADAALDRVADALRSAIRASEDGAQAAGAASLPAVTGVCVAVPGLVDYRRGLLRLAPNLGWRDVHVLDELRARAGAALVEGTPMRLDNEANLAALGELWAGGHLRRDGTALGSFLHISGEIGVGAAVVLDGELFEGTRGFSGEIGHLPLDPAGRACPCGARGCLEQYAGQEAILRRAGLDRPARTSAGRADGPIEELVRRAETGDPAVLDAVRDAGRYLGIALSVAVNLVDVDTVLLDGIYARLARWLREPVETELAARVLTAAWDPVRVVVGALGAEAAVRGAATCAVRSVIDDPAAWIGRLR